MSGTQSRPGLVDAMDQGSLTQNLNALTQRGGPYAAVAEQLDQHTSWDGDQRALQLQINQTADKLGQRGVAIDPEAVTGDDNLAGLSVHDIENGVTAMRPDVLWTLAEGWVGVGKQLGDLVNSLNTELFKTMQGSWSGGRASADAVGAISAFTTDSGDLADAVTLTGHKLHFAQRGIDETKRLVQPLIDNPPSNQYGGLPNPGDLQNATTQQNENLNAARQILTTVYSPAIHGGDQGVPTLPSVQSGIADPGALVPGSPGVATGNGSGASGSTNPDARPHQGQPRSARPNQDSSTQQQQQSPSGQGSGSGQGAGSGQDVGAGQGNHNPAGPSDLPALGDGPSAMKAAAADPGAGFGGDAGGAGGGFGGGGSGSGDEPLASPTVGGPAGGSPTAGGGTGAGALSGRPGMGMPGMGMPGGRKGDGDKEHRSADYLRGTHHLDNWIAQGRKSLPAFGVVGDWAPDELEQARAAADPKPVEGEQR